MELNIDTKCIYNDTLAGFVMTNREEISEKLRFIIKTVGSGLAPMDSWQKVWVAWKLFSHIRTPRHMQMFLIRIKQIFDSIIHADYN